MPLSARSAAAGGHLASARARARVSSAHGRISRLACAVLWELA